MVYQNEAPDEAVQISGSPTGKCRERVIRALSPRVVPKPVGSHRDTLSEPSMAAATPKIELIYDQGDGTLDASPPVTVILIAPRPYGHAPADSTLTPAAAASHELPYVVPSHPHTGSNTCGQVSGRATHSPGSSHETSEAQ